MPKCVSALPTKILLLFWLHCRVWYNKCYYHFHVKPINVISHLLVKSSCHLHLIQNNPIEGPDQTNHMFICWHHNNIKIHLSYSPSLHYKHCLRFSSSNRNFFKVHHVFHTLSQTLISYNGIPVFKILNLSFMIKTYICYLFAYFQATCWNASQHKRLAFSMVESELEVIFYFYYFQEIKW